MADSRFLHASSPLVGNACGESAKFGCHWRGHIFLAGEFRERRDGPALLAMELRIVAVLDQGA